MNRLENEIEHGKYLIKKGAGKVWNWESPAGKIRWDRRVKLLTEFIKPNTQVLELGCGTGYFTKEIIYTKSKITAIDISPDLLNYAKQEVTANNILFKVENAYNMSFNDSTFDYIVGSSVLHHLDIDKAIKEIYRVLKPGGIITFTEPNMLNPQIAIQKNIPFIKKACGDSPDETAFFKWRIKKLLRKNQFKNIQVVPFDFLHPSVPKIFIPIVSFIGKTVEKISILKEIAGSLYIVASK